MKCPNCGSVRIYVSYTRQETDKTIIRHRFCKICKHKFFTVESACQARFVWDKSGDSPIPKTIVREPLTTEELASGKPILSKA